MIVFMYATGFSMLGVQYMYADVLGIELVNSNGEPLRSSLLQILHMENVNAVASNIANATDAENSTLDAIENSFQLGYNVGKELLMLLTGVYIFNILDWAGVPDIFLAPMIIIYLFMLGRTLIAYIRGV